MKPLLSIIIIFNKRSILNDYALKGLIHQDFVNFETILVDNSNHDYLNISDAINFGVSISKSKYLLFLHQDFEFLDSNAVSRFYSFLLKEDSILGVAGIDSKKVIHTNILHGSKQNLAGHKRNDTHVLVETIDECCFAIRKKTYLKNPLDKKLIFDWHLYAVYLSIYFKFAYKVHSYVLPVNAYHLSGGIINKSFKKQFSILLKFFKNKKEHIFTTCKIGYTNPIKNFYNSFFTLFNRLLIKLRIKSS